MTPRQLLPDVRVAPPGERASKIAGRLRALESPSVSAREEARAGLSGTDFGGIVYERAEGVNVHDVDGNRYVDLTAGFGALLLGHRPQRVATALAEQGSRLWLALGDVYATPEKAALAERLVGLLPSPGGRVLFGLSGADALTAALKTAVLATGRAGLVAFEGSYHGLSHGPLAACGLRAAFREPFADQLNPRVTFAPYPATEAELDAALARVDAALAIGDTGAVLVEPILGRGGCIVPPSAFLPRLATAAARHGALLIADEIWTGLGRSGSWLASTRDGVVPDLVCLGKGLGGGLPVSACIGSARAMDAWGAHGGATIHTATHFGWPLACATACATLDELADGDYPARADDIGRRWVADLKHGTKDLGVRAVRGRGLMVGIAVEGGAGRALSLTRWLLRQGWIVLTGGLEGDVLTLTPPLCIDEALLSAFVDALAQALARTEAR